MPSFDTNAAFSTTLEQSKELANTLFKKFVNQAVGDTQGFLQNSKEGIARAGDPFFGILEEALGIADRLVHEFLEEGVGEFLALFKSCRKGCVGVKAGHSG